ncbi:PadR family transcriptional regulator [Asanoa siamensis]|uniref:PadR family transcriptional regulator n=1 Tax=Asanoa siamensis TaxID=926357 RepID=A0ABQ4D432_9ACTN|nr:PadR family transcriptional regulator [Asanoa siamensis]GIF78279.1 PadR family transcriptional regulator [Asanoa siamensis]
MQEPTFLVLTVLAGPALHGYGIMRAIDEVTQVAGTVRPGTLYAALDRLTQEGLVEVDREDEWAGGRVRRYYCLTPHGADTLRGEAQRRRDLAAAAMRRLATLTDQPKTVPTPLPA